MEEVANHVNTDLLTQKIENPKHCLGFLESRYGQKILILYFAGFTIFSLSGFRIQWTQEENGSE